MPLAALRSRRTVVTVPCLAIWAMGAVGRAGDAHERSPERPPEIVAVESLDWLRRPEAWQVRWSRPITAGPVAGVASIIAWIDDAAVHGVRAVDGLPPWRSRPPGVTRLFPRRAAGRPQETPITVRSFSTVAVTGHLLYAVIDSADDGPMLVCLDCSTAAEGRLLWSSSPPAGMSLFDGPPIADDELCLIVARGADGRGMLELVAYDALDGSIAWRRPLGMPTARDGLDHGRGLRLPMLHERLVIVADHAGGVSAFDRDGRNRWRLRYEAPARRAADAADPSPRLAPSIVAADGIFVVAPLDRGGVVAIASEPEGPRLLWGTPPGDRVRIVGAIPDRIVVESWPMAEKDGLALLATGDGRPCGTGGAAAPACGPAVMAGPVILQPTCDRAGRRRSIALIDPATLSPVGLPFPLPSRDGDGDDAASSSAMNAMNAKNAMNTMNHDLWLAASRSCLMVAGDRTMVCIGAAP
ncbi:MAG: PQQ-binding-like beta-propeller repeat protein [Planctomycetia bacterium]